MRQLPLILIIQFCLIGNYLFSQSCCEKELYKYPLKAIIYFCQSDTTNVGSIQILSYDKEYRLIQMSSLSKDSIELNRIVYNYNQHGQLESEEYYSLNGTMNIDRKRIYEYNENLTLKYDGYDDERANNTKNKYTYNENGQLLNIKGECNYSRWTYSYEYDNQGRLAKRYKDYILEISYEYLQEHLIKEIQYNRYGNNEITYEYDDLGQLIFKKENENIIEKNIYLNGQLVEQWTYYFGIDPGYHPCRTQYFIKYEYY